MTPSPARPVVPPARGVVQRQAPDGDIRHERTAPCPDLAPFVAHFWSVAWDLRSPFVAETLPHPTVHVVFEQGSPLAHVAGPSRGRFLRTLAGRGGVFAVKFRPAMAALYWPDLPISALRNRQVPLPRLCGAEGARAWQEAMSQAPSRDARLHVCETALLTLPHAAPEPLAQIRDLVEAVEHNRDIVRVEQLAQALGVSPRTLERRFLRVVGQSPKEVIRRYRLIDAAERLREGGVSIAALAQDLGYFDQAHFSRDFRALLGGPPRAFRAPSPDQAS